ncbi:MAG: hypothetical protein ACLR2E_04850 [Lachnospiraceae bacterium]
MNDMLAEGTGILDTDAIDKNDETYKAWREDETISLKNFSPMPSARTGSISENFAGFRISGFR